MRTNPASAVTAKTTFTVYPDDGGVVIVIRSPALVAVASLASSKDGIHISATRAEKGWGPVLYRAIFAYGKKTHAKRIISDAFVSPDAQRVWDRFVKDGLAEKHSWDGGLRYEANPRLSDDIKLKVSKEAPADDAVGYYLDVF